MVVYDLLIDYGLFNPPYIAPLANFWLALVAFTGLVRAQLHFAKRLDQQKKDLVKEISLKDQANLRLQNIARYDQYTGLLNNYGFGRALPTFVTSSSIEGGALTCHLVKVANYTYYASHSLETASELIKKLSENIQNGMQCPCLIARQGVDEILVLYPHQAANLNESLLQFKNIVQHALLIEGRHVTPTIDLGGIPVCPPDWTDHDLIHFSRAALEIAQRSATTNTHYLDADAIRKVDEDLELAIELESAISNGELSIVVQPQYHATRGIIAGEVLARWIHPDRGFIPPDRFIHIAERRGIIVELGHCILETALKLIADNREAFRGIRLAVNVSPWQIKHEEFCDSVFALLKKYAVDADMLELEITESAGLDDVEKTRKHLALLQQRGITISLDDFGTGYSSLSQLFSFPVSTLKVDRSFVGAVANGEFENNHVLLSSIHKISSSLGLDTIVEGVETKEQLEVLTLSLIHI